MEYFIWNLLFTAVISCINEFGNKSIDCLFIARCILQLPHNQGRTLRCLVAQFEQLQAPCKQEVLRVAELQADDYHNDRQLYYACRDDREVLCPHIKAGDGRIYRCLYRHKFERKMSEEVRIFIVFILFTVCQLQTPRRKGKVGSALI